MQVDGIVTGMWKEINCDDVAVFLNALYSGNEQSNAAVSIIGADSFKPIINDNNTVTIAEGMCIIYGYVARAAETNIVFNITARPQYWIIVAELDRSVVPNTFSIRALNNQSMPTIGEYTLRQDRLSAIRTGVYQLPIAVVKVDGLTISLVSDERIVTEYIRRAHSVTDTMKVTGTIADGVTLSEAVIGKAAIPCSCAGACMLISNAINS